MVFSIYSDRFLKVPTMPNLVAQQPGRIHADTKGVVTRASNEDLPKSVAIHENTHSLKRHVSWSDTTSKSNPNYDVIPNLENKVPPDIRVELEQKLEHLTEKVHRKII